MRFAILVKCSVYLVVNSAWAMDLTSNVKGTLVFIVRVDTLKYEPFPSFPRPTAFRKSSGLSTPSPPLLLPLPLFPMVFLVMMAPSAVLNSFSNCLASKCCLSM